jgi:hypothetical protein
VPTSLRRLGDALNGKLPKESDWLALIEIANKGWLSPAVYLALKRAGTLRDVPDEPRNYLTLLHDSNRERNLRLKAQLLEAIAALNAKSVEPVILKGAVHLLTCPDEDLGERMIGDLDLSIDPDELARSRAALLPLGYQNAPSDRELGRPDDVGLLELHMQPSGRSARYLCGNLKSSSKKAVHDGAVAWIPSAEARALHLIVHDMIKEGDYWRFRLDLRHLKDLADLARSSEGVAWGQVKASLPDTTGRHSLRLQLLMLRDVFGVQADAGDRSSATAKLLHSARLMAISRGRASVPVRAAGNLWWGLHRLSSTQSWQGFRNLAGRTRNVFIAPPKGSRV